MLNFYILIYRLICIYDYLESCLEVFNNHMFIIILLKENFTLLTHQLHLVGNFISVFVVIYMFIYHLVVIFFYFFIMV